MIERLKGILPILSVSIVVLSMIRETLFYWCYKIPIKYFIGFSELPFLISESLIIYIPLSLLMIGIYYASDLYFKNIAEAHLEERKSQPKLDKTKSNKILKVLSKVTALIYFGFTALSLRYFIITYIASSKLYDLFNIIAYIIANWYFIYLYLSLKNFQKENFFSPRKYMIQFISLSVSIILLGISSEVISIDNGKYKGTHILTDSLDHTSNDSVYFIGMTEKYLFVYNKKDTSTTIIPSGDIIKFKLKNK